MTDNAFVGSQAFNRLSNSFENVLQNSGTLLLNVPIVNLMGKRDGIGASLSLSYGLGTSGRMGLPDNWSFDIPFIDPGKTLDIQGMRYIIDPGWMDATGYASGLKYENNHGVSFVDTISGQPLPYGDSGLTYQFVYADVNGDRWFFNVSGQLLMHADRFGNFISYVYDGNGLLDSIVDSFSQTTQFSYSLSAITITTPDGRVTTVNFSGMGVSSVVDPLGHATQFTVAQVGQFNAVTAIAYPSGKTTQISYGTLSFLGEDGNAYPIPAVTDLYTLDAAGQLLAHYQYAFGTHSGGNTFTGLQGNYVLSSSSDGLLDSNNALYVYNVEVRSMDGQGNILAVTDTLYNFAHVPVQQDTYILDNKGAFQGLSRITSVYDITPDNHNRQPNYLSPKSSEQRFLPTPDAGGVPQRQWAWAYDAFGNTTSKTASSYKAGQGAYSSDVIEQASYFTQAGMVVFTLAQVSTRQDCIDKQVIETTHTLTPNGLDIGRTDIRSSTDGGSTWKAWKARTVEFDTSGRELSECLLWTARGRAGVQQAQTQFQYAYDPKAFTVTTTVTDPLGFAAQHVVSTMVGQKVADITPSGATTRYQYDSIGRVVQSTSPSGQVRTWTYKIQTVDGENSTTQSSPMGYVTQSRYDVLGREIASLDNIVPSGVTGLRTLSTKRYDLLGRVVAQTDVFGNLSTSAYNSVGKPVLSTDPLSNRTVMRYDFGANTTWTSVNDVPQKMTVLDNCGNVVQEDKYPNTTNTDPDSQFTLRRSTRYNGFGKTLQVDVSRIDAGTATLLTSTATTYDPDGQALTQRFSAPDGSWSLTETLYDLNNKSISHTRTVRYPDGRTYEEPSDVCAFDAAGQQVKLTNALGQAESYGYDGDGRLVSRTLFDGSVIAYTYTPDGLKAQESWTEAGTTRSIHYAYDKDGNLLSTRDAGGTLSTTWSLDGVPTSITYPDGSSLRYELDAYSRKVAQTDTTGMRTTFSYTAANQLAKVQNGHDTLQYAYESDTTRNTLYGAPLSVTLEGGTIETYQYDAHDRKVATLKVSGSGQRILDERCVIDAQDRMIRSRMATDLGSDPALNQERVYGYDAFGQLVRDTITSAAGKVIRDDVYVYDGNANVLRKTSMGTAVTYTYNAIDQLMSVQTGSGPVQSQTYDTNGRLVLDSQGRRYDYDLRGKLLSVSGGGSGTATTYTYYPNELMATRTGRSGSVQMFYDVTQQVVNTVKRGVATQFLLVGARRFASYTAGSEPYYYGTNQRQDTVMGLNAAAGKAVLVGTADYAAYGADPDSHLGLDASNDFAWNQEYRDEDNALVYLRARFYDPRSMRFISRDPTLLDNRYAFGNGNPIANIDPSGHDALSYALFGVGVGAGVAAVGAAAYFAITYGAAATAAVGGTGVALGVGSGALAGMGALMLGASSGTAALTATTATLATTALMAATGAEASVAATIGASIGSGLGAYAGAALAGTVGEVVGSIGGGLLGGAVGMAAETVGASALASAVSVGTTAMGYASAASATALSYASAVGSSAWGFMSSALGYGATTAAAMASTAVESTVAAASAVTAIATEAAVATAAVAAEATVEVAPFLLLALLL